MKLSGKKVTKKGTLLKDGHAGRKLFFAQHRLGRFDVEIVGKIKTETLTVTCSAKRVLLEAAPAAPRCCAAAGGPPDRRAAVGGTCSECCTPAGFS